jgi:hypothetical protein
MTPIFSDGKGPKNRRLEYCASSAYNNSQGGTNMDSFTAAIIAGGILAVSFCMLAGDYLGYKAGRMKLFTYLGLISLGAVVVFAIIAAINALSAK